MKCARHEWQSADSSGPLCIAGRTHEKAYVIFSENSKINVKEKPTFLGFIPVYDTVMHETAAPNVFTTAARACASAHNSTIIF